MRILIANRGEIARRIARTARRLGHEVVGVTTAVDASSVHARELNAVEVASYLDGAAIIAAAMASQADAVHPGYGFLSENAAFARSVVEAGLIWIGPKPEVIESMRSQPRPGCRSSLATPSRRLMLISQQPPNASGSLC
jgi:acetyl/propionyl-CoA carboxylase alpha subunit